MIATKMKKISHILVVALVMFGSVVFAKAQGRDKEKLGVKTVPGDSFDLGGRTVVVPAPAGFTNGLGRFERFTTVMTGKESPDLDILAAHVPISKVEELTRGPVALDLYTKVSINKRGRTLDVTPEMFTALIAAVKKNFGNFIDPSSAIVRQTIASANTKLKEQMGPDAEIDLGQQTNLGFFDEQPRIFSGMVIMKVTENGSPKVVLTSVSYLLLNKRCVYAYCIKALSGGEDAKTLQDFTKKWTAALIAANK